MSQPNFLQVERSLSAAVAWCTTHNGAPSAKAYGASLVAMQRAFDEVRLETNATYTSWRSRYGEELRAFKRLRLAIEATRELADEHAIDGCPERSILYTERAEIHALAHETIAFLAPHASQWSWIARQSDEMTRSMAQSDADKAAAEAAYATYTVSVKRRVGIYAEAVALLNEFLEESKADAPGDPGLAAAAYNRG